MSETEYLHYDQLDDRFCPYRSSFSGLLTRRPDLVMTGAGGFSLFSLPYACMIFLT